MSVSKNLITLPFLSRETCHPYLLYASNVDFVNESVCHVRINFLHVKLMSETYQI